MCGRYRRHSDKQRTSISQIRSDKAVLHDGSCSSRRAIRARSFREHGGDSSGIGTVMKKVGLTKGDRKSTRLNSSHI